LNRKGCNSQEAPKQKENQISVSFLHPKERRHLWRAFSRTEKDLVAFWTREQGLVHYLRRFWIGG
jgi:hypothetical protein